MKISSSPNYLYTSLKLISSIYRENFYHYIKLSLTIIITFLVSKIFTPLKATSVAKVLESIHNKIIKDEACILIFDSKLIIFFY